MRECGKEQEVRSGLCTWNTEAENRGRDLGCAGEPAQLSGEAATVRGKLGGATVTAQAGEQRDQLVGASGSNSESGGWSQRRDAADDDGERSPGLGELGRA